MTTPKLTIAAGAWINHVFHMWAIRFDQPQNPRELAAVFAAIGFRSSTPPPPCVVAALAQQIDRIAANSLPIKAIIDLEKEGL